MRQPAILLLACSLLACTDPDEPGGTAPTGLYQLAVDTVSDDCAPARSTQSGEQLPVLSDSRDLVVPYPDGPESGGLVPWSRATVLRRATSPTVLEDLDCPGVTMTLSLEVTDETAASLDVSLVETWTGLSTCTEPGPPADDCRSERALHFDLEDTCEAPCELVANDCSGGCEIEDVGWHCECSDLL